MSDRSRPLPDNLEVRKDEERHEFELLVDGEHAGLISYRDNHDVRAMPHTEVDAKFEGRGLSKPLIQAALDQTREEGLKVLPMCPAISRYIQKNLQYADLVPQGDRARYGLE